jgi:hypothetical protein
MEKLGVRNWLWRTSFQNLKHPKITQKTKNQNESKNLYKPCFTFLDMIDG